MLLKIGSGLEFHSPSETGYFGQGDYGQDFVEQYI